VKEVYLNIMSERSLTSSISILTLPFIKAYK